MSGQLLPFAGVLQGARDESYVDSKRGPNAGSMWGQRLRRWPRIKPALGRLIVFAGMG